MNDSLKDQVFEVDDFSDAKMAEEIALKLAEIDISEHYEEPERIQIIEKVG